MNNKKRILVIGTGGTIASKQSESGLIPLMSAEELVSHVPDVLEYAEIAAVQVCNLDSTDITPSDWMNFAIAIKDNYDKYDGFVICHGTDTLAYTGAALSYLVQDSSKPIVITGAQKPIDAEDTDARRNLRDSILYASNDNSHQVSIVFDGKVIAGTRAKKEKSKSYDAFSSINYPYLAIIRDGRIIRYIKDDFILAASMKETHLPCFADGVSDKVFTLKMTPGFDKSLLSVIFDKYDCIIVESFGLGGIPSYLMDEFRRLMESHNTIVIISTQVANEGSDMTVYGVGHDVKADFDLIETYDMTPESAFAKACWILGKQSFVDSHTINHKEFKFDFYRPINHDLTMV